MDALDLIRTQVKVCEAEGIEILCCPEAILGGLADYAEDPERFAIAADTLDTALAPLASDRVTTIIGFTERADRNRLYNAAALFQHGFVAGLYRKLYPAMNHSVYEAGHSTPVFQVGDLKLGIVICNDSNYVEPARRMAAQGATALFVPANNGLPPEKAHADLVALTRDVDIARATENSMWVIRADVAGRTDDLVSYGSSGIVDPDGLVVQAAQQLTNGLIVAEIDSAAVKRR
jgi:predicted amidohydrolase